ncbi:proline-rich transmembrane protein 1-like [Glandiceps talaboti]
MNENRVSPHKDGLPPPYVFPDTEVSMPPPILGPRSIVHHSDLPRDYLGFALCTAVFCFWPVGLFAVIKSRNVRHCIWRGDIAAAHHASLWAKRLTIITLVVGLILWGIYITWELKLRWLWRDSVADDDNRDDHDGSGGYHGDDDDGGH